MNNERSFDAIETILAKIDKGDYALGTPNNKAILTSGSVSRQVVIESNKAQKNTGRTRAIVIRNVIPFAATAGAEQLMKDVGEQNLTLFQLDEVMRRATKAYIRGASGEFQILTDPKGRDEAFLRSVIPNLLANESITSVNHVPTAPIRDFFNKDRSPGKEEGLAQAVAAISTGRGLGAQRSGNGPLLVNSIGEALEKLFGEQLLSVERDLAKRATELFSIEQNIRRHEANGKGIGRIKNLLFGRAHYDDVTEKLNATEEFVRTEYRNQFYKKVGRIADSLDNPKMLQELRREAEKIFQERGDLTRAAEIKRMPDKELADRAVKELDRRRTQTVGVEKVKARKERQR